MTNSSVLVRGYKVIARGIIAYTFNNSYSVLCYLRISRRLCFQQCHQTPEDLAEAANHSVTLHELKMQVYTINYYYDNWLATLKKKYIYIYILITQDQQDSTEPSGVASTYSYYYTDLVVTCTCSLCMYYRIWCKLCVRRSLGKYTCSYFTTAKMFWSLHDKAYCQYRDKINLSKKIIIIIEPKKKIS